MHFTAAADLDRPTTWAMTILALDDRLYALFNNLRPIRRDPDDRSTEQQHITIALTQFSRTHSRRAPKKPGSSLRRGAPTVGMDYGNIVSRLNRFLKVVTLSTDVVARKNYATMKTSFRGTVAKTVRQAIAGATLRSWSNRHRDIGRIRGAGSRCACWRGDIVVGGGNRRRNTTRISAAAKIHGQNNSAKIFFFR